MRGASWLATLGVLVLSSTSLAQPITWTGEDGDWNDPSHWDPRPPANDDDVMIVAATRGPNVATATGGRWATDGTVFWETFGNGLLLILR